MITSMSLSFKISFMDTDIPLSVTIISMLSKLHILANPFFLNFEESHKMIVFSDTFIYKRARNTSCPPPPSGSCCGACESYIETWLPPRCSFILFFNGKSLFVGALEKHLLLSR